MSGLSLEEAVTQQFDRAPLALRGLSSDPTYWPDGARLSVSGRKSREQAKDALTTIYTTAQRIVDERDSNKAYNIVDGGTTDHELEHLEALWAMGEEASEIGLIVARRPWILSRLVGKYSLVAFAQTPQLSLLKAAAVLGYPSVPSTVDLAGLRKDGFPNVTILGDAIKLHNRKADSSIEPIPLPKSYKS